MDVQIQAEISTVTCVVLPDIIVLIENRVVTSPSPFRVLVSAWSVLSMGSTSLKAIPAPILLEREVTSLRLIGVG